MRVETNEQETMPSQVDEQSKQAVVDNEPIQESFANVASHLPAANLAFNRLRETYSIEIDLPGVSKEDINVSIEGNHLHVTAIRQFNDATKKEDYYLLESRYGKFVRSFYLPDELDTQSSDAAYVDGRLRITFEKAAQKKRQAVTVK